MTPPALPSLSFLDRHGPSHRSLIDHLAPELTDRVLREVAEADGGRDAATGLAAMKRICDGRVPTLDDLEALSLTKWTEPDVDTWYPDAASRHRGHVQRAFSCSALLVAESDEEVSQYIESENETVIRLCLSAIALGEDTCRCASQLISWRMLDEPAIYDETPFYGLGLLLLHVSIYPHGYSVAELETLCRWLVAAEAHGRLSGTCWARGDPAKDNRWLLGLAGFHSGDIRLWKQAAREILLSKPDMPRDLTQQLASIRARLMAARE